jgi:transcriptional regulator with XRE-family HTH domain
MTRLPSGIAERVRAARELSGLTQQELAVKAQVSTGTIARLEQGKTTRPRDDEFGRIAAALGTTPSELMGISNEGADTVDIEAAMTHLIPNRADALLLASVAKDWEELDEGDQAGPDDCASSTTHCTIANGDLDTASIGTAASGLDEWLLQALLGR